MLDGALQVPSYFITLHDDYYTEITGHVMNQPQNIEHYASVSDDIFIDTGATDPVYPEIYQRLSGFDLGSTNAWTRGQPFDFYRRMREESPVMWSRARKPASGFWSVSRYEDVITR